MINGPRAGFTTSIPSCCNTATESLSEISRATARQIFPRTEHRVARRRRGVHFAGREQPTPHQPAHCGLRGAFGYTDALRKLAVADLHGGASALLLAGQPQVHKKAYRAAIVAHKVSHQHIGNVRIEGRHRYTYC